MTPKTFKIKNLNQLVPMKGVSYSPTPSDDTPAPPPKFFDTDFANSSFPLLWGPGSQTSDADTAIAGRDDINNLSDIGVNFIHLYNWSVPHAPGSKLGNYQRDHLPFLKHCANNNVKVFVPISNYFLQLIHDGGGKSSAAKKDIEAMVAEVYSATDKNGKPAAVAGTGMWGVGNEFDLTTLFDVNDVVTAMAYLVEAEIAQGVPADNLLPVTAPVSFAAKKSLPPGIKAIQDLQTAITANKTLTDKKKKIYFWKDRFVASTNPNNDGTFIANYISKSFPKYFPDVPFFFSEMGCPIQPQTPVTNATEQAKFVADQLSSSVPSGLFLGRCVFQFLDQTAMKTGPEATFGMTEFTSPPPQPIPTGIIQPTNYTPGGGATYNVDPLTQKLMYASVKTAYT